MHGNILADDSDIAPELSEFEFDADKTAQGPCSGFLAEHSEQEG